MVTSFTLNLLQRRVAVASASGHQLAVSQLPRFSLRPSSTLFPLSLQTSSRYLVQAARAMSEQAQPELQEGEKVAWKFGAGKAVGHVDHKLTEPTKVGLL